MKIFLRRVPFFTQQLLGWAYLVFWVLKIVSPEIQVQLSHLPRLVYDLLLFVTLNYDSFFCKNGYVGEPLILEFSPREETHGFDLYDDDTVTLRLDIPSDCEPDVPGLLQVFPEECRIVGDEKAMLYLAKAMLMLRGREQGCSLSFRSGKAPRAALCLTRI